MRSFQNTLGEFERRGVKVVAISVDSSEQSRMLAEKQGYTFPLLSDPDATVIRRYDLLHEKAGLEGDVARPAEFFVDPSGTVQWINLSSSYTVRARPREVLTAIDGWREAK